MIELSLATPAAPQVSPTKLWITVACLVVRYNYVVIKYGKKIKEKLFRTNEDDTDDLPLTLLRPFVALSRATRTFLLR